MRALLAGVLLLTAAALCAVPSTPLLYAEDFYELYHRHMYPAADDIMENLVWLERALEVPFRNPLYALAVIETKVENRRYQALFRMHVNLEIVKLYRTFGSRYQKFTAYFYNYPWKQQNLESLDIAESLYRQAYYYWDQAREHARAAWSYRLIELEEIQAWQDENYRIATGDLDYQTILDSDLRRIQEVREDFQAMDASTY